MKHLLPLALALLSTTALADKPNQCEAAVKAADADPLFYGTLYSIDATGFPHQLLVGAAPEAQGVAVERSDSRITFRRFRAEIRKAPSGEDQHFQLVDVTTLELYGDGRVARLSAMNAETRRELVFETRTRHGDLTFSHNEAPCQVERALRELGSDGTILGAGREVQLSYDRQRCATAHVDCSDLFGKDPTGDPAASRRAHAEASNAPAASAR